MAQRLGWAARLHEIGISIAYSGYHKHSSYIARNADMPGFSTEDQLSLSLLLGAHRGSLQKIRASVDDEDQWALVLTLRMSVLLNRRRIDRELLPVKLQGSGTSFRVEVNKDWLAAHPLSEAALETEIAQWQSIGLDSRLETMG